jgi:hypothetical protein
MVMQRGIILSLLCACALAAPQPVSAQIGQPWQDRGYANLNVGFETASGVLTDARSIVVYEEGGSISSTVNYDSGTLFDFAIGSRVWRNVSAGIAFHRDPSTGSGTVTGSIPHPLDPGSPRALALNVDDLKRSEQAFHLQVGYMLLLMDRVDVHVTLGPSFFRVNQDVIDSVAFQEVGGDFTTVNGTAQVSERSDSAVGFNIGADVTYRIHDAGDWKVGAGMFLRHAGATAEIRLSEQTVESDAGGFQIGFGVRTRF